jgi:hypothetical protein
MDARLTADYGLKGLDYSWLNCTMFLSKHGIKYLREQIAALRGTRNLAVYGILSWFLRSVRHALYLARQLKSMFP